MQIRLSQRNVELFEGIGVEMTSKGINEFLYDLTSKADVKPSVIEELLHKILWKLEFIWEPVVKSWAQAIGFSDSPLPSFPRFSEKQLEMGNRIVADLVAWVYYEGFEYKMDNGETDYTYSIDRAIPKYITGDLIEYIKEKVKSEVTKMDEDGYDIDITLFKF